MKDRLFLNDCLIFQKDSFQIPRNFIELFPVSTLFLE